MSATCSICEANEKIRGGASADGYGAQNPAPTMVIHVCEPLTAHVQMSGDVVRFGQIEQERRSPPREDYVRCTIEFGPFTYEPAVEWREGDGFYEIVERLEGCALNASFEAVPHVKPPSDAMKQAHAVGALIASTWPDRAYFVEVWQEGKRGFAQCVQPYGFPRNR